MYGKIGQKCPSKAVRGDLLEKAVWRDIESFLRDPGMVLDQLRAKLRADAGDTDKLKPKQRRLEALLTAKAAERSRVVALYRRGRLSDADLDQQMTEIDKEAAALQAQLDELTARQDAAGTIRSNLGSAESLLDRLRERLDKPVSWECKRQLVEVLVAGVVVDTIEVYGVVQPKVTISYRFDQPNQLERVVPPQEYICAPIRIPLKPETVGDHLRLRRLKLKLQVKQLAKRLGVHPQAITNWEANGNQPDLAYMPAIIEFLGYNPLPPPANWAQRLVGGRKGLGLTQREFARKLGVDPTTLARWERGEKEPGAVYATKAERLLRATLDQLTCLLDWEALAKRP